MSVSGFKKQFHKASQLVSEKVCGVEGTKLDKDFKELERKVDVTSKAVVEVVSKTAKLSMLNTMSKIGFKNPGYPQAEGLLGECMVKYGRDLGEDTNFGGALVDVGESMQRMAEVKDSLDIGVKQDFIDPLQCLCDKDLREIQKLEGRRLDYDYKKKRQGKISDEEVRQAMEKFHESKDENDLVSQLSFLVLCQLHYHRQAEQVLKELSDKLRERDNEAQSRPRREYTPKPKPPSCKALYDFDPENEGELGFREGDIITLTNQIDENWYEGVLRGQSGFFPLNYVEVLVALPH
ncbi:hypothetical protein CRUP_033557 [Coryphaenoides rupestris]|nr:hypothetical protein CRUP_033557 [Coryphaenoides rupestris]